MNYKDVTIEEAESLYNNNINIICDADKQEIIFDNLIRDGLINIFNELIDCIKEISKTVIKAFNNIKEYAVKLFNKRISKKKFINLLQSQGMQRNDINKLIKNNKDRYTMWRYFKSTPH